MECAAADQECPLCMRVCPTVSTRQVCLYNCPSQCQCTFTLCDSCYTTYEHEDAEDADAAHAVVVAVITNNSSDLLPTSTVQRRCSRCALVVYATTFVSAVVVVYYYWLEPQVATR